MSINEVAVLCTTSVLTAELSQLQKHNVTDITCGNQVCHQSLDVNVTITEPRIPDTPQLITVNTTGDPNGQFIITWTPCVSESNQLYACYCMVPLN